MTLCVATGRAIRAARLRARLSQEELAYRLELSQPVISRYERGQCLGLERLEQLAACLGASVGELIGVAELIRAGEPVPGYFVGD